MDYSGVIVEESLKQTEVLKNIRIVRTITEKAGEKHKTPWLKKWTVHNVIVPEEKIEEVSRSIQKSLNTEHEWYVDLKNNKYVITIFKETIQKKRKLSYGKL